MRRSERIQKKFAFRAQEKKTTEKETSEPVREKKSFYNKHYKPLLLIPALLLLFALVVIGVQVATTGTFIDKGLTLSGGTSITVNKALDKDVVFNSLSVAFPKNELNVRVIEDGGVQTGLIIESDIPSEDAAQSNAFVAKVKEVTSATDNDISVESVGIALGASFFRQTMIALIVAFILVSLVVFFYFRTFVPSALVVLSAVSDILITVAVLDVMKMKIGTAGIAALLMLIGYSVDTDILLTMRVLKRKENQTVYGQTISSFKTGITMNLATLAAVLAGLLIAQSPTLREIMIIVVIGVLADILNTWLQNAGLLRWYLERKGEQ